jgi:ribosomal protein S18 acetylase RimI-like enzyme
MNNRREKGYKVIEIRPLLKLDAGDIEKVITEHATLECYRVSYSDSDEHTSIELQLVPLSEAHIAKYSHFDDETMRRYNGVLKEGYSFGAFKGEALAGFIVAETQQWNDSLWVWEFHVAGSQRGKGIGKRLMETVAEKARTARLRIIVCETQNTNASAIKAYHKLGFRVEGIDISYYTNHDYPERDVAVFMKRRL